MDCLSSKYHIRLFDCTPPSSLWGGLPLSRPRLVTITVAYWDSGVGSWSLSYDGEEGPDTGNCTHHCFTVTKTDTRR